MDKTCLLQCCPLRITQKKSNGCNTQYKNVKIALFKGHYHKELCHPVRQWPRREKGTKVVLGQKLDFTGKERKVS